MNQEPFQKNSISWQLQQLQQRVAEWWELQLRRISDNLLAQSLPPWFDFPLVQKVIEGILWLLLAGLGFWLAWNLWRRLRPYLYRLRKQLTQPVTRTQTRPDYNLSAASWLARSQQYRQQGNYYQACRCLYLAMLQQLHERGIVPHQDSRTDGEYEQLIQQLPQPQPYQTLLRIHQQLCFGQAQASLALWEECQQAYRDLLAIDG